jgi:hypothetical protein
MYDSLTACLSIIDSTRITQLLRINTDKFKKIREFPPTPCQLCASKLLIINKLGKHTFFTTTHF